MKWVDEDFYEDIEKGSPNFGMAFLGIVIAALAIVAIILVA